MIIPDFRAVSLDEAIAKGDEMLGDTRLSDWVSATNAQREADQHAFESASPVLHGISLVPGQTLLNLTVKPRYGTQRRRLNCVFVKQQVSRDTYGADIQYVFRIYGGNKASTWARPEAINAHAIVGATEAPWTEALKKAEAERKARGW